jgi:hypothetical protein
MDKFVHFGIIISAMRRSFKIDIVVNNQRIKQVVIDPHYELNHAGSISDALIVELVSLLDGGEFIPEAITKDFEYFATEEILNEKKYRLVWLLEKNQIYIGVVNAYRRKS